MRDKDPMGLEHHNRPAGQQLPPRVLPTPCPPQAMSRQQCPKGETGVKPAHMPVHWERVSCPQGPWKTVPAICSAPPRSEAAPGPALWAHLWRKHPGRIRPASPCGPEHLLPHLTLTVLLWAKGTHRLCVPISFSDREAEVQRRAEKTRSLRGRPGGPKSQATAESALLTAWVSLAQHNPGPKGPAAPGRLLGSRRRSPSPRMPGSGGLPSSSRGARPAEPAAARLRPMLSDQQPPLYIRVPSSPCALSSVVSFVCVSERECVCV